MQKDYNQIYTSARALWWIIRLLVQSPHASRGVLPKRRAAHHDLRWLICDDSSDLQNGSCGVITFSKQAYLLKHREDAINNRLILATALTHLHEN